MTLEKSKSYAKSTCAKKDAIFPAWQVSKQRETVRQSVRPQRHGCPPKRTEAERATARARPRSCPGSCDGVGARAWVRAQLAQRAARRAADGCADAWTTHRTIWCQGSSTVSSARGFFGVAYLGAADNSRGPLLSRLRGLSPPVVRSQNGLSAPYAALLACLATHRSCLLPYRSRAVGRSSSWPTRYDAWPCGHGGTR